MSELPTEAWLVALSGLTRMGPARITRLLQILPAADLWGSLTKPGPLDALANQLGPGGAQLVSLWRPEARRVDVEAVWNETVRNGIGVSAFGSASYPTALRSDPEPPAVLFHRGDPSCVADRRVAIVGTRQCSRYGLDVATEFGRKLAGAGVTVVSGLALGVDAAAHRGALAGAGAAPVAVVGSGLDVVYPAANHRLWNEVAAQGVIFSEAPLGTQPAPWRFPARNRILAAFADVVVVVESHRKGGSMHTVAEAVARDRQVLAVPGPIRSSASAGTNQLLAEGCAPANDADDVLMALGLLHGDATTERRQAAVPTHLRETLDAVGWTPRTFSQVVDDVGRRVDRVAAEIAELADLGLIARTGPWLERVTTI